MSVKGRRALLFVAAALWFSACVELGGPKAGVVSISSLRLPYPSVVAGDIMRDSLGVATPVSIIAYGADGNPLASEPITYLSLDTTATIDADGTIRGVTKDTLGARIVAGAGSLQTSPQRVIVTIPPTAAAKGTGPVAIAFDNTKTDTTAQTNWSGALELTLTGALGAKAQGYIVTYSLVETPDPATAGTSTVYIGDDAGKPTTRDTTNTNGLASRRVILRQATLPDAVRAGTKSDTVIVRASVKYLGAEVTGSPIQFIIPVSKKP